MATQEDVVEVPEADGELLLELLDASLAAEDVEEEEEGQQLDCMVRSLEAELDGSEGSDEQELGSIHTHQGCEDCGLDDILSDLEGCGCASRWPAFAAGDAAGWADVEAFAGDDDMGEWYMDGIMEAATEEMLEEARSYCWKWNYPYYYCGGEGCTEQVYGSPLWE